MEDLEAKHKKALKALDGEKRAAIKKAKGTKGKKAKDVLTEVEEEYATKLKELEAAYQVAVQEAAVATATTTGGGGGAGGGTEESASSPDPAAKGAPPVVAAKKDDEPDDKDKDDDIDDDNADEDAGLSAKERKQAKARRKKERQREKEVQRQRELELEVANAGPSARHMETQQLMAILEPFHLKVSEVAADGHCLYRAIGAQTNQSFQELRSLCATTLKQEQDEFAPFCEYTDAVPDFDTYVQHVASTTLAEWGGHLELRALSVALQRPIHVYSVSNGTKPLEILPPSTPSSTSSSSLLPIRLSYHLHFYGLGEHYNQVVPKTTATVDDDPEESEQ